MKEMYNILDKFDEQPMNIVLRYIWKVNALERVRSFFWLLNHDRLMTNLNKSKIGLGSKACKLRGHVCETIVYVMHACPKAMKIWINIVSSNCSALL